jgi:hypothetical protein
VLIAHPVSLPVSIGLARDPARLVLWLLFRIAVGEVGLVIGLHTAGTIGTAVTVVSVAVLVYVALLAILVLSLRVEVREGEIHAVAWLVRRRYRLADGPITRLRTPPGRGWFGTQLGGLGVEIGPGVVRDQDVVVLRLAPGSSVIVVPCVGTSLAIVPSSEERLLRALAAARPGSSGSSARSG